MKRFKIEHKDMERGVIWITLHHPPYEDENVLSGIKWQAKDVTITELKQYDIEGEE